MAGKKSKDPYTSRNEFKKDFYKQKDKPPVTAETMYGTGTTRQLDESIMSPDDSMLVEYKQKGGKIKTKKAFMGLAVQASKNPMSLIGLASKNPMSLIGGANKLLKRSQTARDVSGKLGVGGKLISNYYNDKASDKRNREAPKEEVTFDRLQNGGSVMIKTKLGRNKPTKLY
jgi:hypothetical protein